VFLFWFNARFFTMPLTKDLYSTGEQICSIEESLAENQKQQRAAKSVCSVKCSSINNAGFI